MCAGDICAQIIVSLFVLYGNEFKMDVFLPVPYSALFKLRGEIYIIVLFYFLFGFTSGAQVTHFTFNDTLTHTLKHAYSKHILLDTFKPFEFLNLFDMYWPFIKPKKNKKARYKLSIMSLKLEIVRHKRSSYFFKLNDPLFL